ncbi:uncharacterized protein BP01DRAFT_360560 [Aspergillus saccharolyticus JOP 1030-1]|uniref:Uncharacterized protein n=1 Tax=Aspergillus saccharolyticus JOP 1030-1 TaxID=1450539 RepID=A0A318Z4L1_9EURO|nr:hypothetical protein BP01DRAFT_360560 [Aspergillus saccharolyticus JOP 1030-1]PYH41287.1 hypothetical protein BP01DRAFT_360560 [Aspergillus saccharolyticus JOP 1030-1]
MTGGGDVGPRRDDSHSPPAVGGYGEFVGRGGGGRLRSTLSSSPPPPPQPPIPSSSSSQLYQQGHDFVTATTSPADSSSPMYHLNNNNNNTTTTTTSYPSPPSFCTMVDMPSSLSMINPLDFGSGVVSPFADSAAAAAAIYALEDLDVNALPADVFQGDWSWLADEAALRDAV